MSATINDLGMDLEEIEEKNISRHSQKKINFKRSWLNSQKKKIQIEEKKHFKAFPGKINFKRSWLNSRKKKIPIHFWFCLQLSLCSPFPNLYTGILCQTTIDHKQKHPKSVSLTWNAWGLRSLYLCTKTWRMGNSGLTNTTFIPSAGSFRYIAIKSWALSGAQNSDHPQWKPALNRYWKIWALNTIVIGVCGRRRSLLCCSRVGMECRRSSGVSQGRYMLLL